MMEEKKSGVFQKSDIVIIFIIIIFLGTSVHIGEEDKNKMDDTKEIKGTVVDIDFNSETIREDTRITTVYLKNGTVFLVEGFRDDIQIGNMYKFYVYEQGNEIDKLMKYEKLEKI